MGIKMLGHQRVLSNLIEAVKNDSVSHAYIFEGPDGIGRRETALSFSAVLMCGQPYAPCGKCKSCELFKENSNPDFQEIYFEDKSIGVEEVRAVLKGLVIKPLYSNYKVILINDADNMTVQAQNALLKSLEEPPAYVVFILTVQSSAAMAQTIRSRCQRILFRKLSQENIFEILENRYGQRKPQWDFIVSYADGIIGTALDLIDSPQFIEIRDELLYRISNLISSEDTDIFKLYEIFEKNNDRIDYVLRVILLFFRDILVYNQTGSYTILINADKKDIINKNENLPTSRLLRCIQAVWSAKKGIDANANFQLAIEVMLMKIKEH